MNKKEAYSSIKIDRSAGGGDKDGKYAWAILKEEIYDAPEGGNKIEERDIEMIRKDIYDKHIAAFDSTDSETIQIIDLTDMCLNLEEDIGKLKIELERIRNSLENIRLSSNDMSPNEIKSYLSSIEETCKLLREGG